MQFELMGPVIHMLKVIPRAIANGPNCPQPLQTQVTTCFLLYITVPSAIPPSAASGHFRHYSLNCTVTADEEGLLLALHQTHDDPDEQEGSKHLSHESLSHHTKALEAHMLTHFAAYVSASEYLQKKLAGLPCMVQFCEVWVLVRVVFTVRVSGRLPCKITQMCTTATVPCDQHMSNANEVQGDGSHSCSRNQKHTVKAQRTCAGNRQAA